jgi:glycerol-3-phosphate dehydrogenase
MPAPTDTSRPALRARLAASEAAPLDLLIIGGGASGMTCALDAASRGLAVGLIERGDFGEGTSSRSTKLIHGGVRYLRQGRLGLVRESLRERAWFLQAAPHQVHPLEFVIPCRTPFARPYYRTGLALYDAFAGTRGTDRARSLSRAETLNRIPGLAPDRLAGSVRYLDGQFDDARMIIALLSAALKHGAVALNHTAVVDLLRDASGRIHGARVEDRETGEHLSVRARVVLNATGVHTDDILRMETPSAPPRIAASQGIHLLLDASYLGGTSAAMLPGTSDGRVLFAIPWHGRVLYGTTDTPWPDPAAPPRPLDAEIDYLLAHAPRIFARPVTRNDLIATFAGLRPLPRPARATTTAAVSRDFVLEVSPGGLLSLYGGKWTTCRAMAEAAINRVLALAGLPPAPCRTRELSFPPDPLPPPHRAAPTETWVRHAVLHEMARTVDDLLLRRCRLALLDPAAAHAARPDCERWLQSAIGK